MKQRDYRIKALCFGAIALLLWGCADKNKPTETDREGTILNATPSALETGSRSDIAVLGAGTAFGDSLWLEKGGSRIPGSVREGGTDTSLIAFLEIPADAATGKWDLVVQGKADHGDARLEDGIAIVPSPARISKVEPSIITDYGDQVLEITCEGAELTRSAVTVRLTKGMDSVTIGAIEVRSDSVLRITSAFSGKRKWDLEIITASRRLILAAALETRLETPFLGSLSPDEAERDMDVAITISGVHTQFAQATRTVWLKNGGDSIAAGGTAPFNPPVATEPLSDTSLKAYFHIPADAKIGEWDLHVGQPWYSLRLPKAFNVLEPTIPAVKTISPASARPGESVALSITGHRVQFVQGTASHVVINLVRGEDTVFSADAGYRGISQSAATALPGILPSGAPLGFLDVHARYFVPEGQIAGNPTGRWIVLKPLRDGFSIQPPSTGSAYIGSVEPMALEVSGRGILAIQGQNTRFGDSVWLERGSLRIPGIVQGPMTETALTAAFDLPADMGTGKWNLVVRQTSGREDLAWIGLSILPSTASITGIKPDTLAVFGSQTLRITARGVDFRQAPLTFRFFQSGDGSDSLPMAGVTVINDSVADLEVFAVDAMKRGKWNLRVDASSKTVILPEALTLAIPVPELVSVAPASGERDLLMALTLTGSNTLFPPGWETVWLSKGSDSIPTLDKQLLRLDPDPHPDPKKMNVFFALPADADTGDWDVNLRQPWYTLKMPKAFHIGEPTAPALKSISPATAHRGGRLAVSITGHRVSWNQDTQTDMQVQLVNGADTLYSTSVNYRYFYIVDRGNIPYIGNQGAKTIESSIRNDAPLGPCDVHARYYEITTSATGSKVGKWIVLPPLLNAFTIEE